MLIESKIRRRNGSRILIDDQWYLFVPLEEDPDGPHVCEVKSPKHIQRFLSIPEGYCIVGADEGAGSRDTEAEVQADASDPLSGAAPVEEVVVFNEEVELREDIEDLLEQNVRAIVAELAEFSLNELLTIKEMEAAGKSRKLVLDQVERMIGRMAA